MKPILHPALLGGPFEDPVLFVDFLFEKRALLFDCGNVRPLPPRKALRVTDVFITHAHMDHWSDFDWLLRLFLGREKLLRLYGPEGFTDHVEQKLRAYTWNVVQNYGSELTLEVRELREAGEVRGATFLLREGFRRRDIAPLAAPDGLLLEDDVIRVRAAVLDHGTPCLGFAVEERMHVNVWKSRLEEMGLPTGPWLQDLRRAVLAGLPDETPIAVPDGTSRKLGDLARDIVRVVPGQRIAYVVDVRYHEENVRRIADLARRADVLFIETPFLDEDAEMAARKNHLTARQAGEIARRAGVKEVVPIHFSPRYEDREEELRSEAIEAFGEGE